LNSYGFFLTYPQCPLSKERIAEHIATFAPIVKAVVAAELHKDGTPHIHVYVKYSKKLDIRQPARFDCDGYHGNYQTAKCSAAVASYCKKGTDYLELGDMNIVQEVSARSLNQKILGKRLMSGENLVDLCEENPELLFNYCKL